MKFAVLGALLGFLAPAACLFPDQAGVVDRMKLYAGPAQAAFGAGKTATIFTDANAVAGLTLANGKFKWRKVFENGMYTFTEFAHHSLNRVVWFCVVLFSSSARCCPEVVFFWGR